MDLLIIKMKKSLFTCTISLFILCNASIGQIPYPGEDPGQARFRTETSNSLILENSALRMEFVQEGKTLKIAGFEDITNSTKINTASWPIFELNLEEDIRITSNDFMLTDQPAISETSGNSTSPVYAERLPGIEYSANMENKQYGISLQWKAVLKDGSNYIRQIFELKTDDFDKISKITLINMHDQVTRIMGTVDGSPVVHEHMFFALEFPLSKVLNEDNFFKAYLTRVPGKVSTVWGVAPPNQLRRAFLYYVERERAHPYHQVLHYNSWFDISWEDTFTEAESLDRIRMFGDSLINKRELPLKAFLLDDGWDDHRTLWGFHEGFPDGFDHVKKMAESYNSTIGVWLSPFGGYGEAKRRRIEYGIKQDPPFETNARGFSMAGPVYYSRFREVTLDFLRKYDVSMFKFDGLGAGNAAMDVYQKDVEAFLDLMLELYSAKPDLYISITTGTWPSVYWLRYGDNIWRGGQDTDMTGEGTQRQQWITYRDADVYENVVKRGPLFPLNSLMLCGICIADHGNPGTFEMTDKDISDEIWSFFATGTNLQEMYINPHKLSTKHWNYLADAAKWAKENEHVLVDTHWIGGDPAKGEIYGYASWAEEKGILSLRNPSSREQTFKIVMSEVFDLPDPVKDNYTLYDVRAIRETGIKQAAYEGSSYRITLAPFEHRLFEAYPTR